MKNTSPGRWGVDTNVLAYLFDQESPFHHAAMKIIEQAQEKHAELVIIHQNITEFVNVLVEWYHLPIQEATRQAESIVNTDVTLIHPLPTTIRTFLRLCRESHLKKKGVFDLYLAATLLDHGVKTLVTNDRRGFEGIRGLRIIPISS